MKLLANIVGVLAVALYVLSFQMKKRRGIIGCNAASRILYVTQYILLFAFDGAVLDSMGFFISLLAQQKDCGFVKRHWKVVVVLSNLALVAAGLSLYQNGFSLLAMAGILLEMGAFWLSREKYIRAVSFLAQPCWLIYNFVAGAYGSVAGNLLTMGSILVALVRYGKKTKQERKYRC